MALAQTRQKPTLADLDELEPKVNGVTCNGVQDSADKGPSERYAVSQMLTSAGVISRAFTEHCKFNTTAKSLYSLIIFTQSL